MIWNVFYVDANKRKVEKYNIFKHSGFARDVEELKEQAPADFEERLKKICHYYFWGKREWELCIADLPWWEHNERDKFKEHALRWLKDAKKVDVWTQLELNWNIFVNYVKNN